MCMFVYVCTCVYIYVCVYIYTYNMYIHTCIIFIDVYKQHSDEYVYYILGINFSGHIPYYILRINS